MLKQQKKSRMVFPIYKNKSLSDLVIMIYIKETITVKDRRYETKIAKRDSCGE